MQAGRRRGQGEIPQRGRSAEPAGAAAAVVAGDQLIIARSVVGSLPKLMASGNVKVPARPTPIVSRSLPLVGSAKLRSVRLEDDETSNGHMLAIHIDFGRGWSP